MAENKSADTKELCRKENPTKKQLASSARKDRHKKVEGRGRRTRMPALCAARIFQLTRELNHKSDGETIQWLLEQAEPSIIAATGTGTTPASALTTTGSSISKQGNSIPLYSENMTNWTMMNGNSGLSHLGAGVWPHVSRIGSSSVHNLGLAARENPSIAPAYNFHGVEVPTIAMDSVGIRAFFGGHNQQNPDLELGLSQDGYVGLLHSQAFNQFYKNREQQMQNQEIHHERDDDQK